MTNKTAHVCWKCRWLVTEHGFLFRKNSKGPCDRCLQQMTSFQCAVEDEVWLKYIPKKDESKEKKNVGRTEKRD